MILPSTHFQTIPRPLRVPLSLIPPEHMQVSSIAENDLDMTLCVFFRLWDFTRAKPWATSRLRSLCRMNKLGIYFGVEKQESLLHGDISNAVVDRYFVYGFQAAGMHLCGPLDDSPAMIRLQARYAQKAWETLADISRTGNQKLKAQGLLLFVYALVVMGFPKTTRLYLSKLDKIIDEANLRFLPEYGRPPELSEQVREDVVMLSQAIYLDNYISLTLDGSAPMLIARIEREFRLDLQVRRLNHFWL